MSNLILKPKPGGNSQISASSPYSWGVLPMGAWTTYLVWDGVLTTRYKEVEKNSIKPWFENGWRDIVHRDIFWWRVIEAKYGSDWGWCSKMVLGPYGVGSWNNIR